MLKVAGLCEVACFSLRAKVFSYAPLIVLPSVAAMVPVPSVKAASGVFGSKHTSSWFNTVDATFNVQRGLLPVLVQDVGRGHDAC